MHADIDDFFMIGKPEFLSGHSASLIGAPGRRKVCVDAVRFLLSQQLVVSACKPEKLFAIMLGSGQGLIHSPAVCNAAFLHSHDLCGLGLSLRRFAQEFDLLLYVRYIDNLLFVIREDFDGTVEQRLMQRLSGGLAPYKVKLEESALCVDGVDFLDMHISACDGIAHYRPILRQKGPLLSPLSAHTVQTLASWPLAYVNRLYRRSSTIDVFFNARFEFLRRLRLAAYPADYLQYILDQTRFFVPYSIYRNMSVRGRDYNSLWLVVPFHPLLSSLPSVLSRVQKLEYVQRLLQEGYESIEVPRFRIAFSIRGTPFGNSLIRWTPVT